MKFSSKVALGIGGASCAVAVTSAAFFYFILKSQINEQFLIQLNQISQTTSFTLIQMDNATDLFLKNTAKFLREKIPPRGKYRLETLKELARELEISHIYIADRSGKYIFSTSELLSQLPNMFSYNPDFKSLLDSDSIIRTAIIPSLQLQGGYKFASFSSHDRTFLFEVSLEGLFIGEVLMNSLKAYSELESIELYASNGAPLYCLGKDRIKCSKISNFSLNIPQNFSDKMTLTTQVASTNIENGENARIAGNVPYHYLLRISLSKNRLIETEKELLKLWEVILLLLIVVSLLVSRILSRFLVRQISVIGKGVEEILNLNDLDSRIPVLSQNDEMGMLAERINRMVERLQVEHEYVVSSEKLAIAIQVAHDIRSPLSALAVVVKMVKELLPEGSRLIITTSISRIEDIANNLIQLGRETRKKIVPINNQPPTEGQGLPLLDGGNGKPRRACYLISSIVSSLVTEKRMEYRSKIEIEIESVLEPTSYGIFAYVDLQEFKRVLSNLINNAVESLEKQPYQGHVIIGLRQANNQAVLTVADNGTGIASDLLPKLGTKGVTAGKKGGLGVGLHHAKDQIKKWGGDIKIESVERQGTTVTVLLPMEAPPIWFVREILISAHMSIIILDDDSSVHHIWDQRLKEMPTLNKNIKIFHFSTPEQIESFVNSSKENKENRIFLIDFELLGFDINGIEIIERHQITQEAILVTSQYESHGIIEKCEHMGLKLIPKEMVAFVPMVFFQR